MQNYTEVKVVEEEKESFLFSELSHGTFFKYDGILFVKVDKGNAFSFSRHSVTWFAKDIPICHVAKTLVVNF